MAYYNEPIRTCKKCGVEAYTLEDCEEIFLKDSKVKTGYRNMCKSCRRKQYQEYEESKRSDESKARHKKYYEPKENRQIRKKTEWDGSYTKNGNKKYKDLRTYEEKRDSYYKSVYGITLEEYNAMFTEQEGCCKICNKPQSEQKRRMAVDHCHETLEVRGLLCTHCNKALGMLQDDIELMEKAIKYLQGEL